MIKSNEKLLILFFKLIILLCRIAVTFYIFHFRLFINFFVLIRYATEWLLTMFCRGFSFDLVTRVWDVFFSEGYKIVYRVALALVKVRYTILL